MLEFKAIKMELDQSCKTAVRLKADPHSIAGATIRASQDMFKSDFWKMIVLKLITGTSERMVPSFLQQLSNRTADETPAPAEKNETD